MCTQECRSSWRKIRKSSTVEKNQEDWAREEKSRRAWLCGRCHIWRWWAPHPFVVAGVTFWGCGRHLLLCGMHDVFETTLGPWVRSCSWALVSHEPFWNLTFILLIFTSFIFPFYSNILCNHFYLRYLK